MIIIFLTENTPLKTERDTTGLYKHWDAGGEKESDNLLLKQLTTPEEEAQHRKWSMERTPMRRILQTPEQKIK